MIKLIVSNLLAVTVGLCIGYQLPAKQEIKPKQYLVTYSGSISNHIKSYNMVINTDKVDWNTIGGIATLIRSNTNIAPESIVILNMEAIY